MKRVAVTYKDGMVNEHFGHCEEFKLYDIEDGKLVAEKLIRAEASGHEAMSKLMVDNEVDVLICGGLGESAQEALLNAGIEIYAGAEGPVDEIIKYYLEGTLEAGEGGCGCGCGGNCGSEDGGCGGCGGGCGGCHSMQPTMEGKNVGKTCRVHYRGTFNDGTQFDASYDRGEPLEFVCGVGMMIKGFDKAVADLEVGDKVDIHLMPEEAYGLSDPEAIFTVELAMMPGAEKLNAGEQVYLTNAYGQHFPVTVVAKDDTSITFDANHEMAGKELNFSIELLEVIDR